MSQQLGALQTHTMDTFLFISHTTNLLLFKFRCSIFMLGSVVSGTHYACAAAFFREMKEAGRQKQFPVKCQDLPTILYGVTSHKTVCQGKEVYLD